MIRMVLRMTTRPGDTESVLQALRSVMLPARIERTCLRCELCVDAESRDAITYSEDWESEEELRRQIVSERFVRVLLLMEMADRPPDLEFVFASKTRGLDFVEAVKRQGAP
jgi:quinol monooxygenase YgiN